MTTYIMNAPILTAYAQWKYTGPLTLDDVEKKLKNGFVSAIGHQSSADFLTQILGINIPMNRIKITINEGDEALIFNLNTRLPENTILDINQIEDLPYEFGLLTRYK